MSNNVMKVQINSTSIEDIELPVGSGTLDVFNTIIDKIRESNIEINMIVMNPRFYPLIAKDVTYKQMTIYGNRMNLSSGYQEWNGLKIMFTPFIEDWYIIPKCKWHEQNIEGITKIAVANEL